MIVGSNGKLTIYVGDKKVKAGYVGSTKVYPNSFLEVTDALTFVAAGETKQLVINCNDDQAWSLVVPEGFTANATSGSGPTTVNITAANNTTETAKTGTITVTSVDDLSATVSLSQAAGVMAEEYTEWTTHSVQLTATTTEFSATGGTATCSTHVSEDRFKITKWNGIETNRATENQVRDVSTEATYVRESGTAGSISGRTITFGNNATTNVQTAVFTATYDGYQSSITCTQAAGSQVYDDISITTFSYPQVEAGGGTSSPSLAYSQVWTWNGVEGSGGTITSGASVSYSGSSVNASSGVATVGSKGTSVSGVTTATTATVSVSMNGKSASTTAAVSQAANSVTSYGTPTGLSLSVGTIPASGGTISSGTVSGTVSQSRTFTSGSTDTINSSVAGSSYSAAVTAGSKGTTESGVTVVGTLTYYYTCNGVQNSASATVNQDANTIVSYNYGNWSVSLGNSGTYIPASGGTITFSPIASRSKSPVYTSGSIGSGTNETATATVETVTSASLISISQTSATAANRYQTAGDAQTAVVKATYSGVSSANISITLAANNPTTNVTCSGTTRVVTYSNWPSGAPNNSTSQPNNYECGYRVYISGTMRLRQDGRIPDLSFFNQPTVRACRDTSGRDTSYGKYTYTRSGSQLGMEDYKVELTRTDMAYNFPNPIRYFVCVASASSSQQLYYSWGVMSLTIVKLINHSGSIGVFQIISPSSQKTEVDFNCLINITSDSQIHSLSLYSSNNNNVNKYKDIDLNMSLGLEEDYKRLLYITNPNITEEEVLEKTTIFMKQYNNEEIKQED